MAESKHGTGVLQPVIVRTVCATGRATIAPTVLLTTDYPVDGILGSRISGVESTATLTDDDEVLVSGQLEVHVWYSYNQGTRTGVAAQESSYEQRVKPLAVEQIQRLGVKEEVLVTVEKQPRIVDHFVRTGETANVGVSVSMEVTVDIVGISKVWIMIYPPPGGMVTEDNDKEPVGESFAFLERDDSGLILPGRS